MILDSRTNFSSGEEYSGNCSRKSLENKSECTDFNKIMNATFEYHGKRCHFEVTKTKRNSRQVKNIIDDVPQEDFFFDFSDKV